MNPETYSSYDIVFEEEQRIDVRWVRVLLWLHAGIYPAFMVVSIYEPLILGKTVGKTQMYFFYLILFNLIMIFSFVVSVWVLYMKLEVRLHYANLQIRLGPIKNKMIPIDEIVSWKAVEYRPIRDYGGWGIRYSFKRRHWAYTMPGNRGVLIGLANGKEIMIGSRRPEQLADALEGMKKGY